MVLGLSIVGCIFSLLGNILIALKKRSGWIAWIIGNIAWVAFNFADTVNIPMVIMYCVYFVLNIFGFVNWSKTQKRGRIK